MAIRKQRERPSDETLERVRYIVVFRARHSPPKPADGAIETNPLASLFYSQMMSFVESRELAVLYHRGRGMFDKHDKLHYRITEHRAARLHLSHGNYYWAALSNARGWAEGRDPGPLRQVTLDVLDIPYEKARSLARTHYLEAMRLSTRREIEEEAGAQLSALRS